MMAVCDKLAREHWKKSYKEAQAQGGYTLPFHKGTEKELNGYGEGIIFCTLSAYVKGPQVINRQGELITRDGPDEFYAGCYARASVSPYIPAAFPKTMCLGLRNLQKMSDGDRLDSFTTAADDFGVDASEYDTGGDDPDEFDPTA